MKIVRQVAKYLLPALRCPCCGAVTTAASPAGQAGSVFYRPVLNAAAIMLAAFGNVPLSEPRRSLDMLLGMPLSGGFVDKANVRLPGGWRTPGSTWRCVALAAEPLLAADESRSTCSPRH